MNKVMVIGKKVLPFYLFTFKRKRSVADAADTQ